MLFVGIIITLKIINIIRIINGTITYTKGDKSDVKFDGSEKVSGYTKVVKKAQTIEKLDLSKYDLIYDILNYM